MASRELPGLGLNGFWALGEDGWKDGMDENLLELSTLVQAVAIDLVSATPGSPVDKDIYLFSDTHPTQANKVAVYDVSAWVYYTPIEGWMVYDTAASVLRQFDGTEWIEFTSGGGGGGISEAPIDGTPYARQDADWVSITGGGGGGYSPTILGSVSGQQETQSAPAVNFHLLRMIYVEEDFTIDEIHFATGSATPTCAYQPFVYAGTPGGAAGALLATGPQIVGTVAGLNEAPLSAPVFVTAGSFIWIGVSAITAAMANLWLVRGYAAFSSNGGSTVPPNPAPGFGGTTTGAVYGFWAKGSVAGGGGGGDGKRFYWEAVNPPRAADFTQLQGTPTLTDEDGALIVNFGPPIGGNTMWGAWKAPGDISPASDWEVYGRFRWSGINNNNVLCGISVYESSSSRHYVLGLGNGRRMVCYRGGGTSYNNILSDGDVGITPEWFRIRHDLATATMYFEYSQDGKMWNVLTSQTDTAWFTAGADSIGVDSLRSASGTAELQMALMYLDTVAPAST